MENGVPLTGTCIIGRSVSSTKCDKRCLPEPEFSVVNLSQKVFKKLWLLQTRDKELPLASLQEELCKHIIFLNIFSKQLQN